MLKHILELTPKYLKSGHRLMMHMGDLGYPPIIVIREDTIVYLIHEAKYHEEMYSYCTYHGKFGWIKSMWLEDV